MIRTAQKAHQEYLDSKTNVSTPVSKPVTTEAPKKAASKTETTKEETTKTESPKTETPKGSSKVEASGSSK